MAESKVEETVESVADEVPQAPAVKRRSLLSEFVEYLMENKKWWLIPIILMVLLLGAALFLANTASVIAPFIYPLF